nr:hypothetical protein [Bacteroides intestinalis]
MNPLNWPKHIPKSYWNSDTHKAVVSGSNDAAAIIAAPFVLYGLGAAGNWLWNTGAPLAAKHIIAPTAAGMAWDEG